MLFVLNSELYAESIFVEMKSRPSTSDEGFVLGPVNQKTLRCSEASKSSPTCFVSKIIPAPDCDWECQDGVLSGQGKSLFYGEFETRVGIAVFRADGAFDTYQNKPLDGPVYRLRLTVNGYEYQKLNHERTPQKLNALDFSKAEDSNFVLDPNRATAMLEGSFGLLATGFVSQKTFYPRQVFRQWSPRLGCDTWAIAKAIAFPPTDEESLDVIVGSLAEAETYPVPEGKTLRWLMWESEDQDSIVFRMGIHELWSEVFSINRRDCHINILEEH